MAKITKVSPFAPSTKIELYPIKGIEFSIGNIGLYKHKNDLMIAKFVASSVVAGVFTKSTMCSDPVIWCRKSLKQSNGNIRGLIVNSGCSNTFTGPQGMQIITKSTAALASIMKCDTSHIYVSSTGVIGVPFDENLIPNAILTLEATQDYYEVVRAIETTDTFSKVATTKLNINGHDVHITGIIKGSGMIEPNMATMLCYIFTDANIEQPLLQACFNDIINDTLNSITVDSDSSTSDTALIIATGMAGNPKIININQDYISFKAALYEVALSLAQQVVMDGEGAQKFITISVLGAVSDASAKIIAKSIANSPLVKTAIAGEDANWGRIAMAIGKTLQECDRNKIIIKFGDMIVASNWQRSIDYNELLLGQYLKNSKIFIEVNLGIATGQSTVYTCDLTHEYIAINADYRS